ncbi:MAG: Transcriptional regulator, TetR family protein [Chloroflexi bacterium]|jgi:AcrR family transcriptional regulator|nr:Transcriptional regulator, TetR family protein [Chloroflexota bacterium]
MGTKETREIVSRRARPAKAPLSKDAIVSAALDLLTREGLPGLSLRKVAGALDTGAASLYVYVANLGELQALVFDHAIADVVQPDRQTGDWRRRLKDVLGVYFSTLRARPGLAQLAMTTLPVGPNALRLTELLLDLLLEGGMQESTAAWAVDLLMLYVTAFAAEQGLRENLETSLGRADRVMRELSPSDYPHIHALRESLLSGPGRFEWALDVLLTGLLEHAPPPG